MMEQEQWKDINGYEGIYQVSSLGRVKSLARTVYRPNPRNGEPMACPQPERILAQFDHSAGYLSTHIARKQKTVHRLVAMAFVPGYREGLVVNHKDENRHNNRADNLEWVSQYDNIHYGTGIDRMKTTKRETARTIEQIDSSGNVVGRYKSSIEASAATGIGRSAISNTLAGYSQTAGGFRWQYVETE